jgi:hypothetical protein
MLFARRRTRIRRSLALAVRGVRRALLVCLVASGGWACTETAADTTDGGDEDAAPCWPASADTRNDAEATGCVPLASFAVCQVPTASVMLLDGATVAPDGAPAPPVCTDACGVSEFALSCESASPDIALRCTIVFVPAAPNETIYCCPCASASP